MTDDLWEVRTLPDGLTPELRGDPPALVIVQGNDRVVVELGHVKAVVAAMVSWTKNAIRSGVCRSTRITQKDYLS